MDLNIEFLLGINDDPNGRSVDDYLKFSGTDWETQHDVIQMAFPTKTQSKFHPNQPFLSAGFVFADLPEKERQRCRSTISLLLHSYMKSLDVQFLIIKDPEFIAGNGVSFWAHSRDHNTLRLTRILECLGIFEMTAIQNALFEFLVYEIAGNNSRISGTTVAFWVAAKENKLDRLR